MKRRPKGHTATLSLIVVAAYATVALLSATGVLAWDWGREVAQGYLPPSTSSVDLWLGTDIFGRSVLWKTVKGAQVAMSVGLVSGLISVFIGVALGSLAGYFGGRSDELIVWFYTTLSSIPGIMLLMALAYAFGRGLHGVYLSLGLTSWTTLCRLVRAEVMRQKEREYVQAASGLGAGHARKLFQHILPNIFSIVIVQFSLGFQVAIKSEVILSYLGLGVQEMPSWGRMIDDAKLELTRDVWWQLAAATMAMFLIVLAFNLLSDALRDAWDPKLVGRP